MTTAFLPVGTQLTTRSLRFPLLLGGIVSTAIAAIAIFALFTGEAFGAHPLITDDTGTQGKGKFQLEVNGEYSHDSQSGVRVNVFQLGSTLSYGLIENLDLVLSLPYQHVTVKESGSKSTENGIGDVVLEAKWRFYEHEGVSLALKPGITLPTGDDERGMGTGRVTGHLFLIATKEVAPWAMHLNLGYIRNENKADDRKDIFHASLAVTVEVVKGLKLVANTGIERNPDRSANSHPAFILGGLIYSPADNFDVDFGVKGGLNSAEVDYAILAGITWRF